MSNPYGGLTRAEHHTVCAQLATLITREAQFPSNLASAIRELPVNEGNALLLCFLSIRERRLKDGAGVDKASNAVPPNAAETAPDAPDSQTR